MMATKREEARQAKVDGRVNAITDGIRHPIRRRILEKILEPFDPEGNERKWSPTELADALGENLTNVSYHVRMLADRGLIVEVDTQPRRGALEHYYKPTDVGRKAFEAQRVVEDLVR